MRRGCCRRPLSPFQFSSFSIALHPCASTPKLPFPRSLPATAANLSYLCHIFLPRPSLFDLSCVPSRGDAHCVPLWNSPPIVVLFPYVAHSLRARHSTVPVCAMQAVCNCHCHPPTIPRLFSSIAKNLSDENKISPRHFNFLATRRRGTVISGCHFVRCPSILSLSARQQI